MRVPKFTGSVILLTIGKRPITAYALSFISGSVFIASLGLSTVKYTIRYTPLPKQPKEHEKKQIYYNLVSYGPK